MAKPQADADQPDPAGTIAKIITVATQKGGAGKTTTSMNVAADFARRGYRALVVSADKQGSAVAWAAAASEGKPFPARVINLAAAGKTLNRELEKYAGEYEVIVVDTPPDADAQQTLSAMLCSDLVVVPMNASWLDLAATQQTLEDCEKAQVVKPEMLVRLLINGVRKNTTTSTEVEELVTELEYPRFTIQVEYLEDLKKTVKTGSAVPFSRNASAKKMIRDLVSEMIELLDMPYQKEG